MAVHPDAHATDGQPLVAMGPAGLRLIARLETAPPIHIAQVEGAPQGDDCLYRGEVVEDVRDAIPAIEADGVRAAALAEGLGDRYGDEGIDSARRHHSVEYLGGSPRPHRLAGAASLRAGG